jgi:hypothetical protein
MAEGGGEIPDDKIGDFAKLKKIPFEELRDAVRSKEAGEGLGDHDSEERYRYAEYSALQRPTNSPVDQLITRPTEMPKHDPKIREIFEAIVMVESLAETRVLTGFTRIEPPGPDVSLAPVRRGTGEWLPAYRVQGEGIFLVLHRARLDTWRAALGSGLDAVVARARREEARISLEPSPELIALHTLAHLLVTRLSFEAGYSASSIRERLYCAPASSATPMCGILLYTAAGDADGTLGGLVRQAEPKRFGPLLENALLAAEWCSADPICRESSGQGIGSLNLAACHACALLPETSCELGNRLLDRVAIVGGSEPGARAGLLTS